jgi:hypothetical protein
MAIFDSLLPVEEENRLGIFDEICFYKQALLKTFHLDRISIVFC